MPGGGTAPVTRAVYVEGTVAAAEGIVRAGFVLDGWFTDAACTRRYDFSAPLAGDLTLYAKWRLLDEIRVTYDCIFVTETVRMTYYAGETPDSPPPPPERDGSFRTGIPPRPAMRPGISRTG